MKIPFLIAAVPGLWVYGPADAMNDKDLPLMVVYMTWMTIITLYFMWSIVSKKSFSDPNALTYRINAWLMVGVVFAVAFPAIIHTTSSMLVIMFNNL